MDSFIAFQEMEFARTEEDRARWERTYQTLSQMEHQRSLELNGPAGTEVEDYGRAAAMLKPRSVAGGLLGLTQRDIDTARRLLENLPIRLTPLQSFAKRTMDLMVALVAVVLVAPLFLIISVMIAVDSPGPVLYHQRRIGLDGREFKMLKFRTMYASGAGGEIPIPSLSDGTGQGDILFKLRRDPRITRFGGVLRRYSLDELPQFLNVLRGDMSLVGPRPFLPVEVKQFSMHDRRSLAWTVRPGITGLWTTTGGLLSWDEAMRLEPSYAARWSLRGDLRILLRTATLALPPRHGSSQV